MNPSRPISPQKPLTHRTAGREGPIAVISRRAAERLRAGHVWVYQSDIEELAAERENLVAVVDNRGLPLGTALWSPNSQIALRLVSSGPLAGRSEWLQLLDERLRRAIQFRHGMVDEGTDACRLVFSEADQLPGIIVDRYGDLVLFEILSKALDTDDVRAHIVQALLAELDPSTIVERADPRIRELEHLSEPPEGPIYSKDPVPQLAAIFHVNGLAFHYDARAGQKTGAFLDQRLNYAVAAHHAHGDALDVCTYQGGFALHLAAVCPRVTGVDASRAALEVAEENLIVNRHRLTASVDWLEANAFDLLRDWSTAGKTYDTIVLDPPAFAKSKRAVEGALRGYKELNLRALKMLRPGGILVTCSCSHHVSADEFQAVVASAAGDAHRRVGLVERRGAAPDHPVVLNIPETEYLKCLIVKVD
ncbi:MAG TPA: class I SAM-dependent rRNA methyltransferase [Acidobacteriaceae bacterium]|nr:class I SAM-dependent rRNA methyltransferase [Acidobacteriaceae bacterium]